jgi:hypothetical protein
MGEFLGALVAIPSSRRKKVFGPYENMERFISADTNSSNSFLRTIFLMGQIDWAITPIKRLFRRPNAPVE